MPGFRFSTVLEAARGIKAFLNLEGGLTRGAPRGPSYPGSPTGERAPRDGVSGARLEELRGELQSREQQIARLESRLQEAGAAGAGLDPRNLVWIFGIGRSGNTWLSAMLGDLPQFAVWPEPCIGELFGSFYYDKRREGQRKNANFVLGDPQKKLWLDSIRSFVLEGASGRFADQDKRYLAVKEHRGSVGAPLLMQALPESRMLLLIRDPRDVVASTLDATKEGSWEHRRSVENRGGAQATDAEQLVESRAQRYVEYVQSAKRAYDAHHGPKTLVKYEDLRADTLGTMTRLFADLGLRVGEKDLARVVERHSWENIPEEDKGSGKFYRKATPGGWREDLTPDQAEVVERVTAPLLREFYPGP